MQMSMWILKAEKGPTWGIFMNLFYDFSCNKRLVISCEIL